MSSTNYSDLYDEFYYQTGCGDHTYQRDEQWLAVFDNMAAIIAREIAPQTVLDAGCALGLLVECLRNRDVEAFGVDISEYAIENVHQSIKPYCWVGSIAEPFEQHYDLIVCIEVLEHMPHLEAEEAIANMCRFTDDILFSSSPLDYKEATHFNVNQPEYWAEQFARHGFFRDIDFGASFITPWAVRFRRLKEPVHRLVPNYERRLWHLQKENTELRETVLETRNQEQNLQHQLQTAHQQHAHFRQEIVHLKSDNHNHKRDLRLTVREKERLREDIEHLQAFWQAQKNTIGWALLEKLQSLRAAIAPPGGKRDLVLGNLFYQIRRRRLVGAARYFLSQPQALTEVENLPSIVNRPLSFTERYQRWLKNHYPTPAQLTEQTQRSAAFEYQPLISFITPVFNPTPEILTALIESVLQQSYPNWQLCLANAGDTTAVDALLNEYAAQDERIVVKHLSGNEGISANSNEALALAEGEFIAILDHDDTVAPNMLYEVVALLNEHPQADVIYFDEDKTSADGETHLEPLFKSKWSLYQLWATNNMMHSVFRRSLVAQVGGFDPETDGAQDWDLALRCAEHSTHFHHLPKILYHWRQTIGSTAGEATAKPWAYDAQIRVLLQHLTRLGLEDAAIARKLYTLHVTWKHNTPKVSLIIPTKNNPELLLTCLSGIFNRTDYPDFEIIVVDNASYEPEARHYLALLEHQTNLTLVEQPDPFNLAIALNLGAEQASGDILVFLHNDIEVLDPLWLHELVQWVQLPDVGLVGAKLINPNGTIQNAGLVLGMDETAGPVFADSGEFQYHIFGSPEWYREYSAVSGVGATIQRDLFESLGGFDARFDMDETPLDLCVRVREAGQKVVYNPFARLLHHTGKSRHYLPDSPDTEATSPRVEAVRQTGDPFFNPNLSLDHTIPTLSE